MPDVAVEEGVLVVWALMQEDALAAAVIERRAGQPAQAEALGDALAGVLDARVGHRGVRQERLCGGAVVAGIDAEEPDVMPVADGRRLEDRELEAARPAPRAPDVDHDRVALERGQFALEARPAARDDPIGAAVQRRQGRRRARKGPPGL